jgi:hypothetical protein
MVSQTMSRFQAQPPQWLSVCMDVIDISFDDSPLFHRGLIAEVFHIERRQGKC